MAGHEPPFHADARAGGSADEQATGSLERVKLDDASGGSRADELREVAFPVALRGYDREAVDAYVDRVGRLVADLEASRSPEEAVRRALDQVGEETSGILQRAQETAGEITARSRAQADDRLREAEREAAAVTVDAEERVRELDADFARVWEQRDQLLDEVRQLAERLLSVADDAEERWSTQPEEQVGEGGAPASNTASFPAAEGEGRSAAALETGAGAEVRDRSESGEDALDFGEVYDHEAEYAEVEPQAAPNEEAPAFRPADADPVAEGPAGEPSALEAPGAGAEPSLGADAGAHGSDHGRDASSEPGVSPLAEPRSEREAGTAS